jgi:hypothetical protein
MVGYAAIWAEVRVKPTLKILVATVCEQIPTRPEPGQEANKAFCQAVKAEVGRIVVWVPLSTMVPGNPLKSVLKEEGVLVKVLILTEKEATVTP